MEQELSPLDWQRMFLGDEHSFLLLVEIIIRTVVMYVAALILVRFIGKRGLGRISPFEFIVVIAMGSAAGDPMFYPDVPLLHGIVVLATVVLLHKALVAGTERSIAMAHFVESTPSLLIRDGQVLSDKLSQEGISLAELGMKLRERGVQNFGEVELAYLEPSGEISVFRSRVLDNTTRGESTLPPA